MYVKHVISVCIKNRSPKAGLSVKQQITKIREVLNDDMTKAVMQAYRPQGMVMKAVSFLLKNKLATPTFVMVAVGAKYI